MTPDKPDATDAIKPVLEQAEAEVSRHLQVAGEAEARDISEETSAELLRLEDELLAAVRAVEQTVAIRQVMEHLARGDESGRGGAESDGGGSEDLCLVREFKDQQGRAWRGWQVIPGRARQAKMHGLLGPFARGWLAFEALDGGSRKRLLTPIADWATRTEEDLVGLLEQAVEVVPRRA